ncbi:hypothetical protein GT022_19680 [Agaribacter marinus]|uniref:Uncharacterized protein n=1 Tax=Virgibacillus salarius TaxID=447199 RepID=A0A941IDB8_9BACI|nr:hypothetical protein [Virgibacillus salarius]MBR7798242.1 hypothetical protein [Virgibacillus salarius]NAZ10950.1 hypothetical protein [Agaribacter marinus]
MSIKAAVLLHASVVEPDNSEGRLLQLLWEMFDLKIHFFERVLLSFSNRSIRPFCVFIK